MNGLELKNIREEIGLTQQQLSNKLDVNIRTVQKWESNESKIQKSVVLMIQGLRDNFASNKENIDSVLNEEPENYQITTNLSDQEVKEIVYKVASNEDRFMQEKAFSNIIEIRVAKKISKLLNDEEEYKKWRNG